MFCNIPLLGRVGCFFLSAGVLAAVENYLPERSTPVPASEPVPVLDFVRPKLFELPELNPAGTHFAAFTKNSALGDSILICEIATGKAWYTKSGIRSYVWITNQHLLLNGYMAIDIADIDRVHDIENILSRYKRGLMPDTGFLWGFPESSRPGRRETPEEPERDEIRRWLLPDTGYEGFAIARSTPDPQKHLYRFDKKWHKTPVNLNEITPIEAAEKPGEMYALGPVIDGRPRAIHKLDTITGTLGEVIYQDARYDCGPEIVFKRGTREISGVSVPLSPHRWAWLTETTRNVQNLVTAQFPGSAAIIVSSDITDSRFIIEVQSDRQPPVFYFLDYPKKTLGLIKNTAPWIDPARMQPTQLVSYKTRDGIAIDGYLILPAGANRDHPVPLLVLVHAGPWQYPRTWGWDGFAQLFASRGYAVFSPNYRGSDGYRSRFQARDRYDFQKMSDDVTDGVRRLLKTGLIDEKRIGIGGVGFGSYLALSGVVDEPELYRCAYALGGVFDWEKAFARKDSPTLYGNRWLQQRLAEYNLVPPSPLKRASDISIPVFFGQNLNATDITYASQVYEMHRAMKDHTDSVAFGDLNLYEENDAYAEVVTRTEAIEKFLEKHLAGN